MSVHDCPCCECEDDDWPAPTPEQRAEAIAREEARLSDRMRPSRDAAEQAERDFADQVNGAMDAMIRALYAPGPPAEGGQLTGLSAWLPPAGHVSEAQAGYVAYHLERAKP